MTTELATIVGTAIASPVLVGAVGYAIKRVSDAYRSRSKTADAVTTKRAEADARKALSEAEVSEHHAAVDFIEAETFASLVVDIRAARAEAVAREAASVKREEKCQVDLERERQARIADLAEERRQRRADLVAAKAECEDRIRELAQQLRGVSESVNSLSPPRGVPKYESKE